MNIYKKNWSIELLIMFSVIVLIGISWNVYNIPKGEKTILVDSIFTDHIIYNKIEAIPEVKNLSYKKDSGKLSILIVQRPNNKFKFYWVQVGIIHSDRFEPIFNFYVRPRSFDIYYYDTTIDLIETLKDWRILKHN
jgi:hypothetical protein